ncbi:MAG: hypothetical protein DCF17_20430 [Shackletoniella antarctica]|uniref:Uncharacterized protein n=1 Tax=Shackletoniella antarctica TaxID=268115 RepID=A0A2W4VXF1_9CYAN|nr:MAG: hypothetical protein DCF17_20430 [Shackletoniella antarctica]
MVAIKQSSAGKKITKAELSMAAIITAGVNRLQRLGRQTPQGQGAIGLESPQITLTSVPLFLIV